MSKFMKALVIIILTGTLGLGSLVATGGIYDSYKQRFGDPKWQVKLNEFVGLVGNDISGLGTLVANWVGTVDSLTLIETAPAYSDASTFTLAGDYSAILTAGKRLVADCGVDGLFPNTVVSCTYGAPNSTVVVTTANLTANLAAVSYYATRNGVNTYGSGDIVAAEYGAPSWANLQSAVAVANSSGRRLLLTPGNWPVSDDLSITSQVHPVPGAIFEVATTKTLTINGNLDAGPHQIFTLTGTGKAAFAAGSQKKVYPHWWYDGGGDWGPAFAAAQTAYNYVKIPSGAYTQKTQVEVVLANRTFDFDKNAAVSMTTLANGTPTANVQNTANVLAGFKVTSADVTFKGGRFTGISSYGGNTIVAILLANGADRFTSEGQYFKSLYSGIWPGGGIYDLTIKDPEMDTMSHGCYVGYQEGVAGGVQQVTRAKFINWNSHNHVNDGLKLGAFADQVEVIGGHFHHNTRDGIDTFVSGQDVSIIGANCSNNTIKGIDMKQNSLYTGTGAGKGGYNRRVIVNGCLFVSNTVNAISVACDDAVSFRPYGFVITNNIATLTGDNPTGGHAFSFNGMSRSTVSNNLAYANGGNGFRFTGCEDVTISGNVADSNYTFGADAGFRFAKATINSIDYNNERLTVVGNVAYGSPTQVSGFYVDAGVTLNSSFIGNSSYNHATNWVVGSGLTGCRFKENIGYVTRNSGITSAIASAADVAHGLSVTPELVLVTPAVTGPSAIFVDTLGAINFKIKYTGAGPYTFYWEAIGAYGK